VGPWGIGRVDHRTADLTWTWEDIELSPDWVQDELLDGPGRLESWLKSQMPGLADMAGSPPKKRRGRPPKNRQ